MTAVPVVMRGKDVIQRQTMHMKIRGKQSG